MKKLMRDLLVLAMLGTVSAGAFAQKRDEKRPPKQKVEVITNTNKGGGSDKRPPQNNPPKQEGNRNRPS
jgi:hypothetical protein